MLARVSRALPLMIFILSLTFIASCRNRGIMFRTPKDYSYKANEPLLGMKGYKIDADDILKIRVTPNKGVSLMERSAISAGGGGSSFLDPEVTVTVEYDGSIKMPNLGRLNVKNLTSRELELLLEDRYGNIFVDPFVQVNITNKRIIIFKGDGTSARVIRITDQNFTLLEAIANVGGLSNQSKAHRVKLVRGDPTNPEVHLIDLSKIENLYLANIVLNGGDIIYVEPVEEKVLIAFGRFSNYLIAGNFLLFTYLLLR